jgi:minor extracellular protease Epr
VSILLRAIDWLVGQRANVLNFSLAGPPNLLLEHAVRKVAAKGTVLVAAAGNAGPDSPAAYPAAYADVVAVTAIDRFRRPYVWANRGGYVSSQRWV